MYDASKAMFEDVLGYPNLEQLKKGKVEYVASPVTIWDKELILIDELNRAVPELQSKWLEIIRSRKIMGFSTKVKWVWAAMNPMSYSATNALDDALIGRFAFFLYPPDILRMNEEDRIRVALHINGDDAPSLCEWTDGVGAGTVARHDVEQAGNELRDIMLRAGRRFLALRDQMATLPEFLAKFATLLLRESKGQMKLDGRRLGFLHRNIIANRAIELAKAEICRTPLPDFVESARYVVQASVPVGLNDEGTRREEAAHKMEICFDLLSSYFGEGAELAKVNLVYELFTTPDLMRKAELLLAQDLGELALSKAWTDLLEEDRDITVLAYTALQVEARRPGAVPAELLAALCRKINPASISSRGIPSLKNEAVEYIEEVERLLDQETDLGKLVAFHHVTRLAAGNDVSPDTLHATALAITRDIRTFEGILAGHPAEAAEVRSDPDKERVV